MSFRRKASVVRDRKDVTGVFGNLVMLAAFKAVVRPNRSQVGSIPIRPLHQRPR
jgi:hypothetical protein